VKAAPEILTTPRMRGEGLGPGHQKAPAPIVADPRVGATMGGVATPEEVAEQLALAARAWEREASATGCSTTPRPARRSRAAG
jgi:hypothetical protein